jgi:hypothetical protein
VSEGSIGETVVKSIDNPLQPWAWRDCLLGVRGGGAKSDGFFRLAFSAFRFCITLELKTVSKRLRPAGGTGVGLKTDEALVDEEACVRKDEEEVLREMVLILFIDERSDTEEREDGGGGAGRLEGFCITADPDDVPVPAGESTGETTCEEEFTEDGREGIIMPGEGKVDDLTKGREELLEAVGR